MLAICKRSCASRINPVCAGFCGRWLACDADASVHQLYRGDAIAGKPGAHLSTAHLASAVLHRSHPCTLLVRERSLPC
ncbi:hypothetical protein C7U57_08590 [Pseudomonas sp. R9.37]|nr:hypothetical protein C7U57_08590 [Pseudomonas sp. R9.37]